MREASPVDTLATERAVDHNSRPLVPKELPHPLHETAREYLILEAGSEEAVVDRVIGTLLRSQTL